MPRRSMGGDVDHVAEACRWIAFAGCAAVALLAVVVSWLAVIACCLLSRP